MKGECRAGLILERYEKGDFEEEREVRREIRERRVAPMFWREIKRECSAPKGKERPYDVKGVLPPKKREKGLVERNSIERVVGVLDGQANKVCKL